MNKITNASIYICLLLLFIQMIVFDDSIWPVSSFGIFIFLVMLNKKRQPMANYLIPFFGFVMILALLMNIY